MNIYPAISNIMSEIGAISKDKKNQQQGFMYRGIDDVMNALQPLLIKHKVFAVPEILEQTREERTTNKGGTLLYSICKIKYTFYADDGSSITAVVVGEGMDSGDKATNKAMAIAFKYACFQVFCIPTEEMKDPDAESHEVEGKKPNKPTTKPAKSGDKISEAQIKRMFAIAKGDKDIIQRVLDKCGYEKEADVYKSDYNDVCALIEAELQGETKVEMATWEQIDEISKLAKGKYGDNKEEYKAALKTLHEMGKISTPFPIDRNKNIKWTVEDYKAVKEDLETPY